MERLELFWMVTAVILIRSSSATHRLTNRLTFPHPSVILPRPPVLHPPLEVEEIPVVTKLRDYLRIPSTHPDPKEGYELAIKWLKREAEDIGLDFHLLDLEDPHEFALWMTWNGTNPSLKSLLLNSHMDVAAVDPSKWTYPPFEAYKDENGNIYARGASDMKSVTIAELEAIRRLKDSGFRPLRTIHISIMPDEELSGKKGMKPFIETEEFKNLNIGLDIDEGFLIDSERTIYVTYAEKCVWQFNITARGEASHASNFPQYSAGQRLQYAINKLMEYRQSEYNKLENPDVSIEDITSLNLVRLGGGIGPNVIPNAVWASFDMRVRLGPNWNFADVENMLLKIVQEARLGLPPNDVTLEFITKSMEAGQTIVNASNIWWTELQAACEEMDANCEPHVLQAATDGRYVRTIGIPVFGFSPFPNTPITAHQDDEYINETQFLKGIDRYITLLKRLAMVPDTLHP